MAGRKYVIAVFLALLGTAWATPVLAASHGGPKKAPGQTSSTPTGNDISYPQCGGGFPAGQAFGIVGVNDGLADNSNPCLGPYQSDGVTSSELYWATTSSGTANSQGGSQPAVGLYVNTADPGNAVTDWPNSSISSDPYQSCTSVSGGTVGQDSQGCAWQFGYNMAVADGTRLTTAATTVNTDLRSSTVSTNPASYPWWLDVETANSWQSGTSGQRMNVADIQGMLAGLGSYGVSSAAIGVYSTSYQWGAIVGTPGSGSFPPLADWIPGARSLSGAESNCGLAGFTGPVAVTQWFSHPFDGDYACLPESSI